MRRGWYRQPRGACASGDAGPAAQTLWAACHGLVSLRTSQKLERTDEESLMALMLDTLFQGLVID